MKTSPFLCLVLTPKSVNQRVFLLVKGVPKPLPLLKRVKRDRFKSSLPLTTSYQATNSGKEAPSVGWGPPIWDDL